MSTEKSNPSGNKLFNTISLETAKEDTSRWRKFLAVESNDFNIETINRGAFISFEDIDELKRLHDKNHDLIGVRAYFALNEIRRDNTPLHHVKLILVPVEKGGHCGKDIVEIPIDATASKEIMRSTIYDFTMPCPDFCDESSALF